MKLDTNQYVTDYFKMFDESQKAMAASIQSLKCCEEIIKATKSSSILDCGSGISTVFFNSKFENVTTIDHSPQWANVTKDFLQKNMQIEINIESINAVEEKTFDFVFYDYGDIETRIFYFKQALEKCKKAFYIDDMHINFYREYVESRTKKYKLQYIPQSVDEHGRYGAVIIK